MDIDPDISNWIIDFLLRQQLEDRTVAALLRYLPIPDDKPNLKISLLLRKLQSDVSRSSISESSLEILERLEELLFQQGVEEVLEAMKHAYCAVAVESTVKFLTSGRGGEDDSKFKFYEAVKRVWRGRVGRMEKLVKKGGLGSNELWDWKNEMEAAVWDDGACESLLKKSNLVNAVEAVGVYLREAWERQGPSFLELAAHSLKDDEALKGLLGIGKAEEDEVGGVRETCQAPDFSLEMRKENFLSRSKHAGSISHGGVKIPDSNELVIQPSDRNCKLQHSAEVDKVREALISSSLDLRAVVKDPLPDALQLAETISGLAAKTCHDNAEMNHVDANLSSGDGAQVVRGVENIVDNVSRQNLMEHNGTVHTYKWDDSVDNSMEDSAGAIGRLKLPSPKNIHVSPLKSFELLSFKRRRRIRKWSPMEEEALRTGVEKYGRGNWKAILAFYHDVFEGRTEVDLKDKWRNLSRS